MYVLRLLLAGTVAYICLVSKTLDNSKEYWLVRCFVISFLLECTTFVSWFTLEFWGLGKEYHRDEVTCIPHPINAPHWSPWLITSDGIMDHLMGACQVSLTTAVSPSTLSYSAFWKEVIMFGLELKVYLSLTGSKVSIKLFKFCKVHLCLHLYICSFILYQYDLYILSLYLG